MSQSFTSLLESSGIIPTPVEQVNHTTTDITPEIILFNNYHTITLSNREQIFNQWKIHHYLDLGSSSSSMSTNNKEDKSMPSDPEFIISFPLNDSNQLTAPTTTLRAHQRKSLKRKYVETSAAIAKLSFKENDNNVNYKWINNVSINYVEHRKTKSLLYQQSLLRQQSPPQRPILDTGQPRNTANIIDSISYKEAKSDVAGSYCNEVKRMKIVRRSYNGKLQKKSPPKRIRTNGVCKDNCWGYCIPIDILTLKAMIERELGKYVISWLLNNVRQDYKWKLIAGLPQRHIIRTMRKIDYLLGRHGTQLNWITTTLNLSQVILGEKNEHFPMRFYAGMLNRSWSSILTIEERLPEYHIVYKYIIDNLLRPTIYSEYIFAITAGLIESWLIDLPQVRYYDTWSDVVNLGEEERSYSYNPIMTEIFFTSVLPLIINCQSDINALWNSIVETRSGKSKSNSSRAKSGDGKFTLSSIRELRPLLCVLCSGRMSNFVLSDRMHMTLYSYWNIHSRTINQIKHSGVRDLLFNEKYGIIRGNACETVVSVSTGVKGVIALYKFATDSDTDRDFGRTLIMAIKPKTEVYLARRKGTFFNSRTVPSNVRCFLHQTLGGNSTGVNVNNNNAATTNISGIYSNYHFYLLQFLLIIERFGMANLGGKQSLAYIQVNTNDLTCVSHGYLYFDFKKIIDSPLDILPFSGANRIRDGMNKSPSLDYCNILSCCLPLSKRILEDNSSPAIISDNYQFLKSLLPLTHFNET